MLFKKFNIQGYRAIDDANVELNKNQLVPIIGVNESGKTSILQSILAFDKSKDKTNRGAHLEYKNKYEIGAGKCHIRASIQLEAKNEVDALLVALKVSGEDAENIRLRLSELLSKHDVFVIGRDLNSLEYFLEGFDLPEKYVKRFIRHVLENLPFILYFDDFSDRVPHEIRFPADYSGEGSISSKSQKAEWQKIIEEVVKRSTDGKYSLIDLFEMADDPDDQQALLEDIRDVLNKEIVEEWQQLKKRGRYLADDEIDIELKLNLDRYEDGQWFFIFKVVDKSKKGKKRQFNVTERSKGFQWFFNFTIKLKFNAKYKSNPSGAIYLLDEPGSYLHSSAQDELLKELKSISKTNVILYCTHSQHLLNPDVINVGSIRIASKQGANIELTAFSEYEKAKPEGALAPLYDALRMRLPVSSISEEKIVVTEGITDYYFLKMVADHSGLLELDGISLIPGAGAGGLKDLISLVVSSTELFLFVFDWDEAGRAAAESYSEYFGKEIAHHFVHYGDKSTKKFVLEDHLSKDDKERLKVITGVKKLKTAIIALFYSDAGRQAEFFAGMDVETRKRLSTTSKQINLLAGSKTRSDVLLALQADALS